MEGNNVNYLSIHTRRHYEIPFYHHVISLHGYTLFPLIPPVIKDVPKIGASVS